MKILQIIPSVMIGGAEKFCIELSNELSIANEVIICSLYDKVSDNDLSKNIDKNVKFIALGKKNGLDLGMFFKLYKLVRDEKPNIIHTHLDALTYVMPVAMFSKIVFFHTMHNMADKEAVGIARSLRKIAFKYLHIKPISISKKVLESTNNIYGKGHDLVIENGTKPVVTSDKINKVSKEICALKNDEKTKVFINVASVRESKNQLLLVEVFNDLIKNGENIIFIILGSYLPQDKVYFNKVQKKCKKGIHLLGVKQNVGDYLLQSDAFCLASNYEGLPISLLEAMSIGVVPICTAVGGISDVLSKDFSFISDNVSYGSYKEAVDNFLASDPKKLSNFSDRLKKEFIEKYDILLCAKKYTEVFKNEK